MSGTTVVDKHAEYVKRKLFLLSVIALATAGIGFSIRGDIGGALQSHFFDPVDKLHSAEMTASVLGIVFMGFAVAIAIGSPLRPGARRIQGRENCSRPPSDSRGGKMNLFKRNHNQTKKLKL